MRRLLIPLLCLLLAAGLLAQKRKSKKKDEEPRPQILEILPDPPEAVSAETGRLSFQVSPLSNNGLLSQQVRDALRTLLRSNHGGAIVKIRAFVAGSGDLRRIKDIVAEEFTERKLPLPAVSTLQVGALPMVGAQVVIEAVTSEKKVVNSNGLAFVSAAGVKDLESTLTRTGVKSSELLRVTCFLSSLDDVPTTRSAIAAAYPGAAANFVQMQRLGLEPHVDCEAVGRLASAPASPVVQREGVALVNSPKVAITATQLVFRDQDSDFRLAYQRLGRSLGTVSASMMDVIWSGSYALTKTNAIKLGTIQREFLEHSPAGTAVQIEGLPSTDATAAIELIAVAR